MCLVKAIKTITSSTDGPWDSATDHPASDQYSHITTRYWPEITVVLSALGHTDGSNRAARETVPVFVLMLQSVIVVP